MKKPSLSIVVLSYNVKDMLRDCLNSLNAVKSEVDFEVIVPDNASTDGSADMVHKEFPWVRLIRLDKNYGFAAGNNKARKYCRGKYVLFLNADTVVFKNTIKEINNGII